MNKGEELRYLILAVQREGNRRLTEALAPLGLTPSQAEVLTVLSHLQPLTLTELGERLVCETGTPSRLVGGLIDKGLIEKQVLASDRRAVQLRLTQKAMALLLQLEPVEMQFNQYPESVLDSESLTRAIDLLWRFAEGTDGGEAIRRRQHTPHLP